VAAISESTEWDDVRAVVTGRLANGGLASSVFAQSTAEEFTIEVWGTVAALRLDGYRGAHVVVRPVGSGSGRRPFDALAAGTAVLRRLLGGDRIAASFRRQWTSLRAALDGATADGPTADDGRAALRAVLAATAAASTGRTVPLAEAPERLAGGR